MFRLANTKLTPILKIHLSLRHIAMTLTKTDLEELLKIVCNYEDDLNSQQAKQFYMLDLMPSDFSIMKNKLIDEISTFMK